MAKIKLTKSIVDAAAFRAKEYELRDTVVPGFLLKVTPAGRKVFMVQYWTNAGERRARDRPVRRCVMDPAANLKDLRVGMLHPGITISTTLENYNLFR
jgi:hypothetical protein